MAKRSGFGQVTKLPSGRYRARYTVPGTVQTWVNGPTTFAKRDDAELWLARQRADIADGVVRPKVRAARTTLREYSEQWLADRRNARGEALRPSTRRVYEHYLTKHIYPDLGSTPMPELTDDVVKAWWRKTLVDRPTLRARTYALLKTICATAVDDDLLERNPCRVRGASRAKPAVTKVVATPAQVDALASAIGERLALAIHLGAWCQVRSGEVLELRRGDVGPDAVSVTRGVTWVDGMPVVGPPKTDAGVRVIAVPPHLATAVEAHLAQHVAKGADALLFPARPNENVQMHTSTFAYYVKEAVKRTGLPPTFRFHMLRHTGLTWAAQAGATLAELQGRAGHSTPSTAMHYQHATNARDRAVAQSLSDMRKEGKGKKRK